MPQPHKKVDPPFEFSQITDQVLIGTNACCQAHFAEQLIKRGVTADISLEGEMVDRPIGVETYLWLPTADHAPPSTNNVRTGIAALKRMLANGQKVYLHCKNGHGRAPTFFAAYLMATEGLTPEEAVARIKAERPGTHIKENQWEFLRSFSSPGQPVDLTLG